MQNCDIWLAYRQHREFCDDQHSHKSQAEIVDCFLGWIEENAQAFIAQENADIVKAIKDWQAASDRHPFTCLNNGNDKLMPVIDELRNEVMLVCPACGWEQRATEILDQIFRDLPKRCEDCGAKLWQFSGSKEWRCNNCEDISEE